MGWLLYQLWRIFFRGKKFFSPKKSEVLAAARNLAAMREHERRSYKGRRYASLILWPVRLEPEWKARQWLTALTDNEWTAYAQGLARTNFGWEAINSLFLDLLYEGTDGYPWCGAEARIMQFARFWLDASSSNDSTELIALADADDLRSVYRSALYSNEKVRVLLHFIELEDHRQVYECMTILTKEDQRFLAADGAAEKTVWKYVTSRISFFESRQEQYRRLAARKLRSREAMQNDLA